MLDKTNKIKTINDFGNKLWLAADTLRGNLSAESYMSVVLGILSLKFINDRNEWARQAIMADGLEEEEIEKDDLKNKDALDVPEAARWKNLLKFVGSKEIGQEIDKMIKLIETHNPQIKGLFASYNQQEIDQIRLGEVVKIFQNDNFAEQGEDLIGRIYEYFLGHFFKKRGSKGGEFYTPRSIVNLIVGFLDPHLAPNHETSIYDPCCGTAGMLVQAKQYMQKQQSTNSTLKQLTVWGQEFNSITWKLGKLNLLLNGIPLEQKNKDFKASALGEQAADTFVSDLHNRLFDYVFANPPFNAKKYWNDALSNDRRWNYGLPPKNNANYAWLMHILYKLKHNGKAGVVLANGALTSSQSNENKIREKMIRDNKISAIVSLPDKLFYTTQISAAIWFFDNNKKNDKVLMIDAAELGTLVDGSKKNKEIKKANLEKLFAIKKEFDEKGAIDIPGLAKSVSFQELESKNFSLLPNTYIKVAEEAQKDLKVVKQELKNDIQNLTELIEQSKIIEAKIFAALDKLDLETTEAEKEEEEEVI